MLCLKGKQILHLTLNDEFALKKCQNKKYLEFKKASIAFILILVTLTICTNLSLLT